MWRRKILWRKCGEAKCGACTKYGAECMGERKVSGTKRVNPNIQPHYKLNKLRDSVTYYSPNQISKLVISRFIF